MMGCIMFRDRGILSGDKERFGSRRRLGKSNFYIFLRFLNLCDLYYDYYIVVLILSIYGFIKLLEVERMNEYMVFFIEENEFGEL